MEIKNIEIENCNKCFFLERSSDGHLQILRCKLSLGDSSFEEAIKTSDYLNSCIKEEIIPDTCMLKKVEIRLKLKE
jgi:hypothetical protein